MKKIIVFCLVFFLIGLTACGGDKTDNKDTESKPVNKIERNIDAVAKALDLKGKSDTYYEMIDAEDGAEFNDGKIEIYQYDPESKTYKDIVAGDGVIDAVAYNEGFMLVVPDNTEPDKEIVKTFKSLVF